MSDTPEDEAPSALSRLERALAGFSDQQRDAEPEPAPEPEFEPPHAPEPDAYDPPDAAEERSSVLDIAGALEAVERLSAVEPESLPPPTMDEPPAVDPSRADARVLAATAAAVGASDDYDYDEADLPHFERAEVGTRLAELEEDEADQVVFAAASETASGPATRSDAADAWSRNLDPSLPYFLVEDGVPAAAEPPPAPVPTLEELRQTIPEEKHSTSVVRTLAEIPILLIVAALIAFLVKTFLAQAYYIPSGSMLPQLQVDDRVVVSKLAYKAHDPRRGDIIVFDDPRNGVAEAKADAGVLRKIGEGIGIVQPSTDEFIKRVIGLPGETVSGHDGHVYINGRLLIEPYLPKDVVTTDFPAVKVNPGRLWVMGDNRSGSADSRVFGQVKIDTIVGRAMVKVWPFDHISFL